MTNVPATALSVNVQNGQAALAIGGKLVPAAGSGAGYWYVVVDVTNELEIVASEFSADASNPPASIASMLGNSSYFLFFIAQGMSSGSLPSGALATFLDSAGAGSQLAALDQSVRQLGAGSLSSFSYVLAATLNDQDLPGFEEASFFTPVVLNMQFLPLQVGGKTLYAPVQLGTQASPSMVRAVQSAGMSPSVTTGE
jgi:hypothetical protein